MKVRYLAAALAVISASAHAENWRLTGSADEMPAIIVFVDADSVRRSGDTVDFRLQFYSEGTSTANDERGVQQRRASCSGATYRVLTEDYYIGPTLQPYQPPKDELISSAVGTIDKNTIDAVCGAGQYQSETIANPAGYASDYFADLAYEDGDW